MKTKRFLSILLSLVLVLGMFPGMSLTTYAGGNTKTITPGTDDAKTGTGTMTITLKIKAAQTITASDVTATYGDTGKKIEATTSGDGALSYAVKSGDAVTVDASGNLTIAKAGTAVITVTAAETTDYAQATKDVTVTVNTKAMTVSAENVNVTVDGQPHGITVNVTDPASGATVKYGTEEGSYTLDASPTQTEVGTKTVYYQVTADNYTTYTGSATVTVNAKQTQTITASDVTATYGDTGKSVSGTTSGDGAISYSVKSGDAVTVDENTGALTILKAGSAVITVTAAETATYAQATKDVNVTVNTKAMTVSAENVNVTVDGQPHGITVNVTDPASGATVKYGTEEGSYTLDASPTQTEVGEKTVYYQVTADNYTTYTGSAKVTVNAKQTQTITASDVTATYGDTDKSVSGTTTGDGAISYAVKSGDAVTVDENTGALTILKAGSAVITVTAEETATYAQATKDVNVTVNKAAPTVTAPTAKTLTYNGQKQELVNAGSTEDGTLYYAVTTENTAPTDESLYTTSIPAKTDAGTYYVWYKVVGDANHNDVAPEKVSVSIGKADATITAKDQTIKEGESVAEGTGNVEVSGLLTGHSLDAISLESGTGETAGKVIASDARIKDGNNQDVTSNYTVVYTPGTLTVRAALSRTVTFKVANGSWNDETTADKTVTLTGYEGDTLKLAADQIPTVGTKPNDTYKAGSWDVTPSTDTAITAATTYTYTYAAKEASVVTKAPEAKTLTYTGSAQELVTAGTVEGGTMQYALGTEAGATQPYTTSIPTGTNAGTYYVWYKAVGDEDHSDSKPACITVTISKPAEAPAPADEEKGEADFKPSAAAPDVKGVEQEAIKSQMEELAKADDTKLKAGQVKDVTVSMETKAVAEKNVPKKEASAIKETAEGMIPAKDRESTKCDFLDIAVSKIVIVYDVKNGKKVKNESDSISAGLTNLAQVIDIPVKYDLTGKFNPLIVRYHNGKAEAFRRLYAAPDKDALKDGTYYVEGTGKNAIVHIYTNRFSTYALLTSGTEEYPKLGDSVTVYRLYYGPTMEHFYTTSAYERRVLIDKYGWVDEGIAWKSPKAPTTDEEKKTIKPVYRLFNPFTTDHHYTKDANERKTLINKYGWKDEGIAFYCNDKGDATVYRLWHPGLITGAHHFTTGKHEYDVLITRGWIGETEAFKVNAAS